MGETTRGRWAAAGILIATVAAGACGHGDLEAAPGAELDLVASGVADGEPCDSTGAEFRSLWADMADEPLHHMTLVRQLEAEHDAEHAARQLDVSASFFRWGRLYAADDPEQREFLATAQELEGAARRLRGEVSEEDPTLLDRVLADGMSLMAKEHSALALDEWENGEYTRAALLSRAAAAEVEQGHSLSGEATDGTIDRALEAVRGTAERLESKTPPDESEVRRAIGELRDAATAPTGDASPR